MEAMPTNTAETKEAERWDKTISANRGLLDLHLKDVWDYRYLIKMFIKRDFVIAYKQTILGPLWYLVQPVVSSLMYAFVFGTLAGVGTDGVPFILFYFSGTMLWSYFTSCLSGSAGTFIANQLIFGKVYFPRLTAPIATCGFHMIKLVIQFALLVAFMLYYALAKRVQIDVSALCLTFPLIFVWIGVLGTSLGLIVSSLTTKYRDLSILLAFALQLAMYATPVVYPLSQLDAIPFAFAGIIPYANPMCAPIELFRIAFFGAGRLSAGVVCASLAATAASLFLGLVLFTRNERNFVDVI